MGDKPLTENFGVVGIDEGDLPTEPDRQDAIGEADFEKERVRYLREQIVDPRHYRGLRKLYATLVYGFMVVWSILVFDVIIVQGFRIGGFHVEVATITTLIGGATISVIGLVGFIVRGIFPNPGKEDNPDKQ